MKNLPPDSDQQLSDGRVPAPKLGSEQKLKKKETLFLYRSTVFQSS